MKILNSPSIQAALVKAQLIKVSHVLSKGEWLSSRDIAVKLGINSPCVVERFWTEFVSVIPSMLLLVEEEETNNIVLLR